MLKYTTPDWKIAQAAEATMNTIQTLGSEFGLEDKELLPYGHHIGKIEQQAVLERLENKPNGKYVIVTAMTPTPLGEGKTTTTIGLVQGLAKRGARVSAAIRQPSCGPTMGMKGSAAGGGLSQCIPLTPYSLNFTGDTHAVGAAHNLAMTALTARMQHERNYDDETLERLSGMRRLNIDPSRVSIGWVMDFCAQSLRDIVIGLGGKNNGYTMQSHFNITVASEVMCILSIARDLTDLRERIGRIIVAYDRNGKPVTTSDLEVAGAMTALLVEAIKPNLIQTLEGQPVLVHTGPFGNIALGQSSVIADRIGLKLSDIHVTEAGFGADLGYEKFWNLKCKYSELKPDVAVIVATVKALKYHGGAPKIKAGKQLPEEYTQENTKLVGMGCENLLQHVSIVKYSGIPPVVCINKFPTDTAEEIATIRRFCESRGVRVALSEHWANGGEGALELADAVLDACNSRKQNFKPLYRNSYSLIGRIEAIARYVYNASGFSCTPEAQQKLQDLQQLPNAEQLGICMVKTQYSVSDNPALRGAPTDWTLRIRDVLHFGGAGLICPVAGDINLMPGTGSRPAFRNIDVDVNTGRVTGLF